MNDPYTDRARRAIYEAQDLAIEMRQDFISPEHLLAALTKMENSVAATALKNLNSLMVWHNVGASVKAMAGDVSGKAVPTAPLPHTPHNTQVLGEARAFAAQCGHPFVGTEHLLWGILCLREISSDVTALQILADAGISIDDLKNEILELLGVSLPSNAPNKASTMQVNGFQIREAIKQHTLKREMAIKLFNDAGFLFPGEVKVSPIDRAKEVQQADEAVAKLETFQQAFNAIQIVLFDGQNITLSQAVKMIAGIGRLENLWKQYASKGLTGQDSSRRSYGEASTTVRKTDEQHATRTIDLETCVELATAFARKQAALRAQIASANGRQIDVPQDLKGLFA